MNETVTERRKRIRHEDRLYAAKLVGWFVFCCLCFASIVLLINVFTHICQ